MNNTDCIFCKIIAGQWAADKVYENDEVLAFLDINPVTRGHTLVVPKKHALILHETDDQDLIALFKAVKLIAPQIKDLCGAMGYNIGINCGEVAGQLVMHTHIHIIPRYTDDGLRMWGGHKMHPDHLKKLVSLLREKLIV